MHRPRTETPAHLQIPMDQVLQGRSYTPFIVTLRQMKKHKPFATNINTENLPKIG